MAGFAAYSGQRTNHSVSAQRRAHNLNMKKSADRLALLLASIVSSTSAFVPIDSKSYVLTHDYSGQDFFDNFQFYSGEDPTHGHVKYVDMITANNTGLAGFIAGTDTDSHPQTIYLGVDYTSTSTPNGRPSTRVSSIDMFNHSLIIADIAHMPAPICGTWPAYWLLGSSTVAPWPAAGEIDILENVNNGVNNKYTLHSTAGIKVSNYTGRGQTGRLDSGNCDVNAPNQPKNTGCSISDAPSANSYGDAFNNNGGGLFATLIDSDGVRIWFFPRDNIPSDISTGTPNPPSRSMLGPGADSVWPLPNARFDGPGNGFDAHFRDMQIIFNIAFCGEWAGAAWNQSSCATLAPTCEAYVSGHPEAFEDVYWGINGVKVYEFGSDGLTVPGGKGGEVGKRDVVMEHLELHRGGRGVGDHVHGHGM